MSKDNTMYVQDLKTKKVYYAFRDGDGTWTMLEINKNSLIKELNESENNSSYLKEVLDRVEQYTEAKNKEAER